MRLAAVSILGLGGALLCSPLLAEGLDQMQPAPRASAPAGVPAQQIAGPVAAGIPAGAPGGADYDPDSGRLSFDFAGLRLVQSRTDDAYLLDIELRGLPAEQVLVRPAGGGLLIGVRRSSETTREEVLGQGYGYRRSWGYSSGQRSRRLPAPPDADVRAMQREDGPERIRISIPKRADAMPYGAPPFAPSARPFPGPFPGSFEPPVPSQPDAPTRPEAGQ